LDLVTLDFCLIFTCFQLNGLLGGTVYCNSIGLYNIHGFQIGVFLTVKAVTQVIYTPIFETYTRLEEQYKVKLFFVQVRKFP
jgi:hypothetical protein